jgi:hypothetical protein
MEANGQWQIFGGFHVQVAILQLVESNMNNLVWKPWATPKAKNHAWLVLQNRLWAADRLRKRGWDNYGFCPLCKQTEETNNHFFVHCRFTARIWELIKEWLGMEGMFPRQWACLSIQDWWYAMVRGPSTHRKGLASLILLTVWEIWKERNARVFRQKVSPSFVILYKIKCKARLWVIVGAKHTGGKKAINPGL